MTSILEQEIYQQPEAVARLLKEERAYVSELARSLRDKFDAVLIAARGTSDNAARFAQYLFGTHNRLPVALAAPSLFTIYQQPPRLQRTLVIGISQSGQSPDIVEVIAEGRRQGQPTLAIVNDPDSPLARAAEHTLYIHAGAEKAVAATKTYTTSLAALALFSTLLEESEQHLQQLATLPEVMQLTLDRLPPALARIERYRYMNRCAVIGRGFNYSTAFEIALKVKELTQVVAEPYSSADFRHGPIAIVQPGFPVMVVAPSSAVSDDMADLANGVRRRGGELLMISDDPTRLAGSHLPLPLPAGVPEWLTPLIAVLPGQLFALSLAQTCGFDVDRPNGLTKVTETR